MYKRSIVILRNNTQWFVLNEMQIRRKKKHSIFKVEDWYVLSV